MQYSEYCRIAEAGGWNVLSKICAVDVKIMNKEHKDCGKETERLCRCTVFKRKVCGFEKR
jgi:hypothetical protein